MPQPMIDRLPRWKSVAGVASAVVLSLLFLASGIWKLSDVDATAERMVQSLVPVALRADASITNQSRSAVDHYC
jgi:hypothetical protein